MNALDGTIILTQEANPNDSSNALTTATLLSNYSSMQPFLSRQRSTPIQLH